MSVEVLKKEFLKLTTTEQAFFGQFVIEKMLSKQKEDSILTENQQQEIREQFRLHQQGQLSVTSWNNLKGSLELKYGI